MVQPVASEARRSLISGVWPIASTTSWRIFCMANPDLMVSTLFDAFPADKMRNFMLRGNDLETITGHCGGLRRNIHLLFGRGA
jgi:hypothetical protein